MAEYSALLERILTALARLETKLLSRPSAHHGEVERLGVKNSMLIEEREQLLHQLSQAAYVIGNILQSSSSTKQDKKET